MEIKHFKIFYYWYIQIKSMYKNINNYSKYLINCPDILYLDIRCVTLVVNKF